jgi:hypothetical protein
MSTDIRSTGVKQITHITILTVLQTGSLATPRECALTLLFSRDVEPSHPDVELSIFSLATSQTQGGSVGVDFPAAECIRI